MHKRRDTTRNSTPIKYAPVSVEETNQETKRKSYKDTWKRASIKLKFRNLLNRINLSNSESELDLPHGTLELLRSRAFSSTTIGIKYPSFFTIMPYDIWYLAWVLFLCVLMFYISTYAVFHTSFIGFSHESYEANFEAFIDTIFCVDLIFSFNLAYFDDKNNLVFDKRSIVKHYFFGDFKLDLLLMFPAGILVKIKPEIQEMTIFMYRHLFRILKWVVLKKRFSYFNFIKRLDNFLSNNRSLIQFISILIIVFLSLNLVACYIFIASRSENFSYETWAYRSNMLDKEISYQYATSLYWALTTLSSIGYGDNLPYTLQEKLIALSWMAAGIYVVSFTAGTFTVILDKILEKDIKIDQDSINATIYCLNHQIPKPLTKKIILFIKKNSSKISNFDMEKLLINTSIELRYEIALDIFNKAITKVPFLVEKSYYFVSIFTFLLQHVEIQTDSILWERFAYADGIYFICQGRVKFSYEGSAFMFYSEGDYFGDVEVFYKLERKFDATVLENSSFFKISNKTLKRMKEMFACEYYELKDGVKKRKNYLVKALCQILSLKKKIDNRIEAEAFSYGLKKSLKKELFFNCEKSGIKHKLEELDGITLDTAYSIFNCKEMIKALI